MGNGSEVKMPGRNPDTPMTVDFLPLPSLALATHSLLLRLCVVPLTLLKPLSP